MDIGKDLLLEMYRTMTRIRLFEARVRDLATANEIPGFVHVSIGEEASAAGICAALRQTDRITSTHRGHGHLIAKGGKLAEMMAEIYGKRTGYCKGKGGSMHIVDFALGILGANGIVGAGLPIATGSALAAVIAKRDEVTACFFGDGASNEGTFHESLNLAEFRDSSSTAMTCLKSIATPAKRSHARAPVKARPCSNARPTDGKGMSSASRHSWAPAPIGPSRKSTNGRHDVQ